MSPFPTSVFPDFFSKISILFNHSRFVETIGVSRNLVFPR